MFSLKKIVFCVTFHFCLLFVKAQKGLPNFGKIDKTDLALTECSFDKNAEAFKLIDWGNVTFERGSQASGFFKTVYKRRQRIKILKDKGVSYADLKIPYYSRDNSEKITKLEAIVYNTAPNGDVVTTSVNKSSIYTKKINKYYSETIIAFPEVKVGSVIEYKYTLERETMGHIKDWYFQDDLPCRYSEYEVTIPLVLKFGIQPSIIEPIDFKEEIVEDLMNSNQGLVTVKSIHKRFIMNNLKALPKEQFMGAAKDYQQRLEFQLSQIDYGDGEVKNLRNTWTDVVRNLMEDEDFGKQLEEYINRDNTIFTQLQKQPTDFDKIIFLTTYFNQNIHSNGEESIYAYNGIKSTFKGDVGYNGDVNLLFIKLLNDVGVKALPILFSTRDNGTVNTNFPFVQQFNTVLSYVSIDNKNYIIDAADKLGLTSLIPIKVNGTKGFLVDGKAGKWINAADTIKKYKVTVATNATIKNSGIIEGETLVINADYAKKIKQEEWLKDKEKFKQQYFSIKGFKQNINDIETNNLNDDAKPFELKTKFSYELNKSGSYHYFTTNLFTGLVDNFFTQDVRQADVDFGYLQEYNIFTNFDLPDNFTVDVLPKNMAIKMPDHSIFFSRYMEVVDNTLSVRFTIQFNKIWYQAAMYPEFKEFYKQLFEALNEQVVLKTK